jgi:tripartite ATP-independent transporter DctM subunit
MAILPRKFERSFAVTFLLGALILVFLIAVGIPVGFAIGLAGIFSMAMLVPPSMILGLMTKLFHAGVSEFVIVTVPMFILMAEFLGAGGVARDLLVSSNRLLWRISGGMAMACVIAGAVLAAASGSSTASAASITRAAYPVMRQAGYAPSFAIGTISIAGTLSIMIPPSVAFILYGLMTDTSIGKLFLAGIIPGILTAMGYVITIWLVLRIKPELGANREKEEALAAQKGGSVWPITTLVVAVMVALYTGIATPSEIGGVGALFALIAALASRRLSVASFARAIGNTLRTTAMIITIIVSAKLFGHFISFTKVTDEILDWIIATNLSPTSVLLLVVLIYLFLGMIMDQAAIIILTCPITAPLMVGLGYDPIWWGVIIIKTAEIGLVSPPLGLNVFVASGAARTDLREGFRGVMPFVATELVLLGVLLAFPQVSLLLAG